MKFGRRKSGTPEVRAVQLRGWEQHPFAGLRSFTPQRSGELRLYQAVREAVPVVDAAVCKLIRLSGGVQVYCGDGAVETRLRHFLESVPVGRGQYGMEAFLDQYLDSLLVYGAAVGELVPTGGNRDLAALLCGRMDRIELREGESPLDFQIFGPDERGRMAALPYQELLLFT
ncbi:MAG: serine/threonine protein phosphatase, partial [Clostridiales bacterium]|nr:serine/threonine protein phosphatase [Clostridiales bacterium]